MKGDGYAFTADGFNEDDRIGFELIMPQGQAGFGVQTFEKEADSTFLSNEEKSVLEKDVESGKVDVLVIDANNFPNMDGDLYTPMEYYLASVVDYLNWVHGDKQIDPMTILGKLPGRTAIQKKQVEAWQAKYTTIPGGSFEDADDMKNWTAEGVKLSRSTIFSGNLARLGESSSTGSHSLQLEFGVGGKAKYTVPEGMTAQLPDGKVEFVCRAYNTYPTAAPLRIVLTGKNGNEWEILQSVKFVTDVLSARDKAPFTELAFIELSMDGDATYMIWLDDFGFSRSRD